MQTKVNYEWTIEKINDGEIVDNDFADKLSHFSNEDLQGMDLGLVRNEGNERDGITYRLWAYVKDGKLPETFSDEIGNIVSIKVPQRFHNELKKYLQL